MLARARGNRKEVWRFRCPAAPETAKTLEQIILPGKVSGGRRLLGGHRRYARSVSAVFSCSFTAVERVPRPVAAVGAATRGRGPYECPIHTALGQCRLVSQSWSMERARQPVRVPVVTQAATEALRDTLAALTHAAGPPRRGVNVPLPPSDGGNGTFTPFGNPAEARGVASDRHPRVQHTCGWRRSTLRGTGARCGSEAATPGQAGGTGRPP